MTGAAVRDLVRERGEGHQRVTTMELFFDLVYVFAVTQLSHYLLRTSRWPGRWRRHCCWP
jgi:low temperature requirement protein LtrA